MSPLARVGTVAAITTGGILLVMVAALGVVIEAAIRCDRDLEGWEWADDGDDDVSPIAPPGLWEHYAPNVPWVDIPGYGGTHSATTV